MPGFRTRSVVHFKCLWKCSCWNKFSPLSRIHWVCFPGSDITLLLALCCCTLSHHSHLVFRLPKDWSSLSFGTYYVSVYSNWVHSPRATPGISSKTCPGVGFDFWKLPGGREFDKDRDFVENESETSKNSVDQIFTGENKKQAKFLTFFEVYLFSEWNFTLSMGQFFCFCYHTYLNKKSEELSLACLYLKFSLAHGYPHLLLYKRLWLC